MTQTGWLIASGFLGALASSESPGSDPTPPAAKLPPGWRELRFGASELEVQQQLARAHPDLRWERTPLSFTLAVDLAASSLVKANADPARIQHWMTPDLDNDAGIVHAWFENGKLFAVLVQERADKESYIRSATEALGSAPRRVSLTLVDETASRGPGPPRSLDTAVWRGNGMMTLVYQTSDRGPELLICVDPSPCVIGARRDPRLDGG